MLHGYIMKKFWEEASRYRSFWWSARQQTHFVICALMSAQVPVFPIYWANGQHGYLENQRYPKPGDKNPEVKIGIVSIEDSKTVWADFNAADDQYFGMPYWAPNGQFWVQWMNRGEDQSDSFTILILLPAIKQLVYEEQQSYLD